MKYCLGNYDTEKLKRAKRMIQNVYEYNYGSPRASSLCKRLETILNKIDYIIDNQGDTCSRKEK